MRLWRELNHLEHAALYLGAVLLLCGLLDTMGMDPPARSDPVSRGNSVPLCAVVCLGMPG